MRTRVNSTIRGKQKVYFTCHPDDFEKYFDMVCEDIFKTQDCTILYTPVNASRSVSAPGEKYANDDAVAFSEINLFVIPVTFKLLYFPNRAMDEDFVYAMEHHIPILPILMENNLDELYAQKFDKLEYLNRMETDNTTLGYETKLSKFLSAVLLSDEMTAKIRAAFDAYIFLSYRKKDRQYANELMRLIHRNPLCRDIAIWYDEYLIPGENFEDTIKEALERCHLFTMVVTPNIMEKGNYVLENEYPEACKSEKPILPVEMLKTDASMLKEMFKGIPDVSKGSEEKAFCERILELLADRGKREQKEDPEHNFLVGLAYLDGIDVEKNYERGLELITASAESGLLEAMQKLGDIYINGIGQETDRVKAVEWMEKAAARAEQLYGPDDEKTLKAKDELVDAYDFAYEFDKAIVLQTEVYEKRKQLQGEDHIDTLCAFRTIGFLNLDIGNFQEALRLVSEAYEKMSKVLGKEHPETLRVLDELGCLYSYFEEDEKMYQLYCNLYESYKKLYGEFHLTTLTTKRQLAFSLLRLGENEAALAMYQELYATDQKCLEPDNQELFIVLSNIGIIYKRLSQYDLAMQMYQLAYDGITKHYGQEHPNVILVLQEQGNCLFETGRITEAIEPYTKAYDINRKLYGEKHPITVCCYSNLALIYAEKGDYKTSIEMSEKIYEEFKEIFGGETVKSIGELDGIAVCYYQMGEFEKSLKLAQEAYEISKNTIGENHQLTLTIENTIPAALYELGQYEKAIEWAKKVCDGTKQAYGEDHLITHMFRVNLGRYYCGIGEYEKSIEIMEDELEQIGKVIGPENEKILSKKIYLVTAYADKGDVQKALEIGNALLRADLEAFGEEHPETVKLKKELKRIATLSQS